MPERELGPSPWPPPPPRPPDLWLWVMWGQVSNLLSKGSGKIKFFALYLYLSCKFPSK